MKKNENQKLAYEFLRARALDGKSFTLAEFLKDVPGWKESTFKTYETKQFASYLLKSKKDGTYKVRRFFAKVGSRQFFDLVTQKRQPVSYYERSTYHHVVTYDFFLPLTREDKLRHALNGLFYRDMLQTRLDEVGLDEFGSVLERKPNESDEHYSTRLIGFIDERIGGFSISHVSGRFRVGNILSREQAGNQTAKDEPYLIDETESPRLSRRLHLLRGWSNGKTEQVFDGAA